MACLGSIAVAFMAGAPQGNQLFLAMLAVACIGFGVWRSVVLGRALKRRDRS